MTATPMQAVRRGWTVYTQLGRWQTVTDVFRHSDGWVTLRYADGTERRGPGDAACTILPKLTAPQVRVLRQVRDGDVCHGMGVQPYDDTLGFDDPARRVSYRVLNRLRSLGLVRHRDASPAEGYRSTVKDAVWRLTDAGRAYLGGTE